MIQQGQVFRLKAKSADGQPLWAYRYRLEGPAGMDPIRGLYDLRRTYATFALRAGVPVFAVSRFIGSSIAMIDRHYGHLARDSREHAVARTHPCR